MKVGILEIHIGMATATLQHHTDQVPRLHVVEPTQDKQVAFLGQGSRNNGAQVQIHGLHLQLVKHPNPRIILLTRPPPHIENL